MRAAAVGQGDQSAIGRGELVGTDAELPRERPGNMDQEAAGGTRFRRGFGHGRMRTELTAVPTFGSIVTSEDGEHPRSRQSGFPTGHTPRFVTIDDRIELVLAGKAGGEAFVLRWSRQDIPNPQIAGTDTFA